MKKYLFIIAVFMMGSFHYALAQGQTSPFHGLKSKSKSTGTFSPSTTLQNPHNSHFASRQYNSATFISPRPAALNISAIDLGRSGFTSQKFNRDGQLIFLEGQVPGAIRISQSNRSSLESACYQYLEAISKALRIQDPGQEFVIKSVEPDELGMNHVKMQQYYRDIPVWCSEVVLHSRDNVIDLFNGNAFPTPLLPDTEPEITAGQAVQTAIADISGRTVYRDLTEQESSLLHYTGPVPEIIIYHKDRDPRQPKLTWHVTIRPNFIEVWEYFVDAENGSIIHFYDNTRRDGDVTASGIDLNGVNRSFHAYLENSVYYLADISRPMFNPANFDGVLSIYDAENTNPSNGNFSASISTSTNNSWSPTEVSAMYNSVLAYEYFRTVHNRNSYNNQGGAIQSIINVSDEDGGGYDNAYWNGEAVFYGNGDVVLKPLAGGLDVGAHEIGHAFEGTASNLEYQYQSGAISESFADISGAMVERQNWTIGEQVVKPAYYPSGCMRDMSDPHNGGNNLGDPGYQPAHMNEMYTGSNDNGGVHINSGIANLAFYKTAEAIGVEKTEMIFWRACFNYLTRSSQFIDLRLTVVQSAEDLHGAGSAEANAVSAAFDFVGITDGQGGDYENELPVNPGPDYILLYDLIDSDPYTLYLFTPSSGEFTLLSETIPINKPSILDDGSYAFFVADDHTLKYVTLEENPEEDYVDDAPDYDNAAISKDGSKLSAISIYEDSSIYVYSYDRQEWKSFHLYNATTAQGEKTYTVAYADAMEWDYSGEYIIYDALSRVENENGEPIEWWDINFLKVWDNNTNNWGSGDIFKVFGGLPEGISVGNPAFAKNSPYVFAFDIYEPLTYTCTVGAANYESGEIGEIFMNEDDVLGTPSYSKLDDMMIFTYPGENQIDAIAYIELEEDKITPTGDAYYLITEAMWGVWFSQGVRPLDVPELSDDSPMQAYPNPTSGLVSIKFESAANGPAVIKLFDTRGSEVFVEQRTSLGDGFSIDFGELPDGLYILQVITGDTQYNKKLMIK